MCIEHWWNVADRGKPKCSETKSVHHKHRMDQPGIEPGSPALKTGHMQSLRQAPPPQKVQYKQCYVTVSLVFMSGVLKVVKLLMLLH